MSGDSPLFGDATQSGGPIHEDRPHLSKDAFVSYASQDSAVANAVVEVLEDPANQRQRTALAYAALGRKTEADTALSTMLRADSTTGAYNNAAVYSYRGDRNKAFTWLERAFQQRDLGLVGADRSRVFICAGL